MKVVVTGAGGFVGRAVVAALRERGSRVVPVDAVAGGWPADLPGVVGDLGDPQVRAAALAGGADALIHLATLPGGAAEADPAASRRINVDAMYDLMLDAAAVAPGLRFVFASSIAVFGDPLPARVDDRTPLAPKLVYGGHKAMMEAAVTLFSQRGAIDGVTARLPGILARPRGPSGMKSAFLSELFHSLRAGERFLCPVSADGTIWAQSIGCVTDNLLRALTLDTALLPPTRAVTLPALRTTLRDLVAEVARQCDVPAGLVDYRPEAALEAAFAAQPPLATPAAEQAGFVHDGSLAALVAAALATLS